SAAGKRRPVRGRVGRGVAGRTPPAGNLCGPGGGRRVAGTAGRSPSRGGRGVCGTRGRGGAPAGLGVRVPGLSVGDSAVPGARESNSPVPCAATQRANTLIAPGIGGAARPPYHGSVCGAGGGE